MVARGVLEQCVLGEVLRNDGREIAFLIVIWGSSDLFAPGSCGRLQQCALGSIIRNYES